MIKKELLLSIAKDAVNWFNCDELIQVIQESKNIDDFKRYYPEFLLSKGEDGYYSNEFYRKIISDVKEMLTQLMQAKEE
jgi:hypothetical protein